MLDLNKPDDARKYILAWAASQNDMNPPPAVIEEGTDEEVKYVARQLFLHADERPPLGGSH